MELGAINSFITHQFGVSTGLPLKQLKDKYVTPESKFLPVEGMELHYRKTGIGPAIILIHGLGSSLHTWQDWHHILSNDFTVISMDIPGFGLTGAHPKNDYSFEMYTKVLNSLIDHLQLDSVYMVGNSLGGIITWNYALRAASRLKKIVLMNAVGFNTGYKDIADFGFMLTLHPLSKKLTHFFTPKSLVKSSYQNAVYDPNIVTDKKVETYYDLLLRKGNRKNFSQIQRKLIVNEEDYTEDIKQIDLPTLIMWGEEDNLISVGDAYKFKMAIEGSELIIYPKVGHLPMEEIPEQSAQNVKEFLLK